MTLARLMIPLFVLAVPLAASAQSLPTASGVAQTPFGDPDLQGIWDYRTMTPLERPRDLAGKNVLPPRRPPPTSGRSLKNGTTTTHDRPFTPSFGSTMGRSSPPTVVPHWWFPQRTGACPGEPRLLRREHELGLRREDARTASRTGALPNAVSSVLTPAHR